MTQRIVDRFEAVQIHEQQGHVLAGVARHLQALVQHLLQLLTVGQARQGVVPGEVLDAVMRLLGRRDVEHQAAHATGQRAFGGQVVAPLADPAHLAFTREQTVLDLVGALLGHQCPVGIVQRRAVIVMEETDVPPEGARQQCLGQAHDLLGPGRPEHLVGVEVAFETGHARQALRFCQAALTGHQGFTRLTALGDVGLDGHEVGESPRFVMHGANVQAHPVGLTIAAVIDQLDAIDRLAQAQGTRDAAHRLGVGQGAVEQTARLEATHLGQGPARHARVRRIDVLDATLGIGDDHHVAGVLDDQPEALQLVEHLHVHLGAPRRL